MRRKKKNNPQDKPNNLHDPVPFLPEKKTNDVVESKKSEAYLPNYTKTSNSHPKQVVINREKKKGWERADIISVVNIFISASLLIMTLWTFDQTRRSVEISEKSFQENQKQFDVQNQPFVQIIEWKVVRSIDSSQLETIFKFSNAGKYPARLVHFEYSPLWTYNNQEFDTTGGFANTIIENVDVIIVDDYIVPMKIISDILNKQTVNQIFSGEIHYYLKGSFIYQNMINKKLYINEFLIKFKMNPDFRIYNIKNEYSEYTGEMSLTGTKLKLQSGR